MRPLLTSLVAAACAALLFPSAAASSHAEVVKTTLYSQTKGASGTALVWTGDPGERNALTYTQDDRGHVLRDESGPIRVGRGCRAQPDGAVACGGMVLRLDAGDGDDSVVLTLPEGRWLAVSAISLGDGDDTLETSGAGNLSSWAEGPYGAGGLDAGAGADVVRFATDTAIATDGGDGDDALATTATAGPDPAASGVGLRGGAGDDTLQGGAGRDGLIGDEGDDRIAGGDGDDTLGGGSGDDVLDAGAGADALNGEAGADQLAGGEGDDTLQGDADGVMGVDSEPGGPDQLDGGPGRDLADYTDRRTPVAIDLVEGVALIGIEDAIGGLAADVVRGDDGPNMLSGGYPADTWIYGFWPGLIANPGRQGDVVEGRGGDDRIDGATAGGSRRWLSGANTPGDPGRIDCGDGVDWARPHRLDAVATACELIQTDLHRVDRIAFPAPESVSLTIARFAKPPVRTCDLAVAATGAGRRHVVLAQQRMRQPAGAPPAAVTLTADRPLPSRVRIELRPLPCRTRAARARARARDRARDRARARARGVRGFSFVVETRAPASAGRSEGV